MNGFGNEWVALFALEGSRSSLLLGYQHLGALQVSSDSFCPMGAFVDLDCRPGSNTRRRISRRRVNYRTRPCLPSPAILFLGPSLPPVTHSISSLL
jgi:hypothetical protein